MKKYSISSNTTYILGISLIIEALKKKPNEIIRIYLSSDVNKNKDFDILMNLCDKYNIECITDDKVISNISTKENCYGIAEINKFKSNLSSNTHIILDSFNDEGELGTIIRSLASFDFENLVLINSNIDIYNPKVIRSSMGGYFHINITKYISLDEYSKLYNNRIITIGLKGNKELKDLKLNVDSAILISKNTDADYYISHLNGSDINDSSLCTIVLNHLFNQI